MPDNGVETTAPVSDVITSLLQGTAFKVLSDEEKLAILLRGRPTPKLNIVKRDALKNCNRTFQETWYDTHKWLCGSLDSNKLFCWPCLLMRPETSSWCATGTDDVKRLSAMSSKHALCKAHVRAINEYDATLVGFGLVPEFPGETSVKKEKQIFKSEEIEDDDDDDDVDDFFEDIVSNNPKKRQKTDGTSSSGHKDPKIKRTETITDQNHIKANENIGNTNRPHSSTKVNGISFKAWQEMNKSSLVSMNNHWISEKKLSKIKRKLAKQELRNARLVSEKIHMEVELIKAQLEYQQQLISDMSAKSQKNVETQTHIENTPDSIQVADVSIS